MKRFLRVRHVERTGSTNDDMARMLGEPDARGLTIAARYQEKGSGRKGRAWIAPPGSGLLFTTALPDPIAPDRLWIVPFWAAVVIAGVLRDAGVACVLKWPNDVLLAARKVAGILCISRVAGDRAWAAFGVGINVSRPENDEALGAIDPPPAFLSDARAFDMDELLAAILTHADERYDDLSDVPRVCAAWQTYADVPGARYMVQRDDGTPPFEARALALEPGGSLRIENGEREESLSLADVRILR